MKPELSIIIPTMDRPSILQATVKSVLEATHGIPAEIIVVNDSKSISIQNVFQSDKVRIVNNPKKGVAAARNLGASLAVSDLLLFLDDDILLSEKTLLSLIEFVRSNEKKICLPNWRYPDSLSNKLRTTAFGRYLLKIRYDRLKGWMKDTHWKSDTEIFEHEGLASYCVLLRRSDFELIKGYDESFSHAGFEDYDFKMKLLDQHFRFYVNPLIDVYHNEEDRINSKNWLNRKRRGAKTQREGVALGYKELKLHYPALKKMLLESLIRLHPVLFWALTKLENKIRYDRIYFRLTNLLVATHIYLGYNRDHAK